MARGAAVDAGTAVATLKSATAGRGIDLGAVGDSGAALALGDAELDRIAAGTISIGAADAGAITISGAIGPAQAGALSLAMGGGITQAAGASITVERSEERWVGKAWVSKWRSRG